MGGETGQLVWAVGMALLLGVWLWLRSRSEAALYAGQSGSRLRAAVLALSLLWTGVWILVACIRLLYPHELVWTGGAFRDHCDRVLSGAPLYAAPGPDWIPFPQPPLAFWLSALPMRLFGSASFVPLRLVSICATLGCAVLLFLWVRRLGGSGSIAVGLFLAVSGALGGWHEVEGAETLFLFLLLLGATCLERASAPVRLRPRAATNGESRFRLGALFALSERAGEEETTLSSDFGPPGFLRALVCAGLAGLCFTLAFLTRQYALLFVLAGALALAWRRAWVAFAFFLMVASVTGLEAVLALNATSGGWFGHYVGTVFLAQPISAVRLGTSLIQDWPLFAPLLVLLLLTFLLGRNALRPSALAPLTTAPDRQDTAFIEPKTGSISPSYPAPEADTRRAGSGGAISVSVPWPCLSVLLPFTLAGLLTSGWMRALGEDRYALTVGAALLIAAGCVVAGRWRASAPAVRAPVMALLLAQMLAFWHYPVALLPTASNLASGRQFARIVRALERQGEVLVLDHGGLTTPRHFHITALGAEANAGKRLPPAWVAALRNRRFVAIVVDSPVTPGEALSDALLRDYAPAEGPDSVGTWILTGKQTPQSFRRVWVLRPRKRT